MLQLPGVEHEPLRTRAGAVTPIASDRMSDRRGVNPNLMGPAGFDINFGERRGPVAALRAKRGPRTLALHRCLDDPLLAQVSFENGQVCLPNLPSREQRR